MLNNIDDRIKSIFAKSNSNFLLLLVLTTDTMCDALPFYFTKVISKMRAMYIVCHVRFRYLSDADLIKKNKKKENVWF